MYKYITLEERIIIEKYIKSKCSINHIANYLERSLAGINQ